MTGTQPIAPGNALGAITYQDGTLQVAAAGTISNTLALSPNFSGGIDANGFTSNFSGQISGSGSPLNLFDGAGGGAITLSGANIYSGVTSIDAVTVGIGNNAAFGTGAIAITAGTLQAQTAGLNVANPIQFNGANTINANNTTPTFSGTFFGSGSVTLTDSANPGAGLMTLSGSSYYSGGTTLSAGLTAVLANNNALGVGVAALGGSNVLRITDPTSGVPITLANSFSLAGANNTIDAFGSSAILGGGIGGVGSLTIEDTSGGGLGVVQLAAPGSWTGATDVNGGTLRLGAANALSDTTLNVNAGTVLNPGFDMNGFNQLLQTVNNNGAIATGAATLTVSGNYNSGAGSKFSVIPLANNAPNLSVAGIATLTGQTLNIAGRPPSGNYTIVASANPITTTFAGISFTNPTGYRDILSYSGDDVLLQLFAPSLVQAAQTPNQSALASALNAQNAAVSADMAAVLTQFNTLTSVQQNAALDQMTPIAYAALSGLASADAGVQSASVGRRVAALQAGLGGGGRVARYTVSGPSPYPGVLVADAGGGPVDADAPAKFDPLDSPWGLFFSVLDTRGRLDGIGGSAGFQPGYDFSSFGGNFGADYRFSESLAAGFTAGYLEGGSNLDDGVGHVGDDSLRFGAYATAWDDAVHGMFYLGGALDSFDSQRDIQFPGVSRVASASPTGTELNMETSIGEDFKPAGGGVLTPFFGLNYDRLMISPFSESGAGALDLDVGSQTNDSFRSRLGLKFAQTYQLDWFGLTPGLSVGWNREYLDQSRPISAEFSTGQGSFSTAAADVARNGLETEAGLTMDFDKSATLRFAYSGDFRKDFAAKTLSGSLRVAF